MGERGVKVRVGLVFGGRSAEHEISIRSAQSVFAAMDRRLFEPVLIGIDPGGGWHLVAEERFRRLEQLHGNQGTQEIVPTSLRSVPGREDFRSDAGVDVVFPILHGAYGEDGTIQGMLEMLDLPYVGAGVLGSAVGMDKDVQKRLLQAAALPVVPFRTVRQSEWNRSLKLVQRSAEDLGLPLFVKPANLGSSVGVHKVTSLERLAAAVEDAFAYDAKILLERGVAGREIECSVLGNDDPQASLPGEIVAGTDFYSYEAKYSRDSEARLLIPAPLSAELTAAVQNLAVRTFQVLECSGMARVDFFLEQGTEQLFVNELNTIPGFTSISMYPKLWEASGLPNSELITRLIDLAFERHAARRRLRDPARVS
jgi:D-alanine-D-alanine ligase